MNGLRRQFNKMEIFLNTFAESVLLKGPGDLTDIFRLFDELDFDSKFNKVVSQVSSGVTSNISFDQT